MIKQYAISYLVLYIFINIATFIIILFYIVSFYLKKYITNFLWYITIMKKIILKILINIFCISLFILILDIIFYYYQGIFSNIQCKNESIHKKEVYKNPRYFVKLIKFEDEYKRTKTKFRPIENGNSEERPIVLFGCSFSYGYYFDDKNTFSYVLSKYSKRPIINRAYNGWGIQHPIYQLENDEDFYSTIKAPKYVFYLLIEEKGHYYRLFQTCFPNVQSNVYYLNYKEDKNGILKQRTPFCNIYYNLSLFRHIQNKIIKYKVDYDFDNDNDSIFNSCLNHFITINNLIKTRWGNDTQFVILTYKGTKIELFENDLKNEGIQVIELDKLLNIEDLKNKYYEPKGYPWAHPTGAFFEELVLKLKEIYKDL